MALDPISYTEKIIRSFLKYSPCTCPFSDPHLHGQMPTLLNVYTAQIHGTRYQLTTSGFETNVGKEHLYGQIAVLIQYYRRATGKS